MKTIQQEWDERVAVGKTNTPEAKEAFVAGALAIIAWLNEYSAKTNDPKLGQELCVRSLEIIKLARAQV